jgi:uncharacterized protein (DUF1015 family)
VVYDPERVDINQVLAPPYDVITPEDQKRYYAQHPCNVVRLIAGEVHPTDHPGDNKYTRARSFFKDWLASGVLRWEQSPVAYVYAHRYRVPSGGEVRERIGLLAVTELEPFGSRVLAHERTHARPKADRLSLTQAVCANLSPVFVLYEDRQARVRGLLRDVMTGPPRLHIEPPGGETHRVWRIEDRSLLHNLSEALQPSRLFIADGHHRYQTALNYRDAMRQDHPEAPADAAFNFVLTLLVDAADPSLLILPTHRVVRELPDFDAGDFLARIERRHEVKTWPDSKALQSALQSTEGIHRVGIAANGSLLTVELPPPASNDPVERLDVTRLHREILESELNLVEGALDAEQHLAYSRDPRWALAEVKAGRAQAAFLLRPTEIGDVLAVAEAGEVMPEKSTYFYPKPLSGIVFNPLEPSIRVLPA